MKRVPRNKAIEIVLQGHVADIEEWVHTEQREELKKWLHRALKLSRMSVDDMINEFDFYFESIEDYEEDDK